MRRQLYKIHIWLGWIVGGQLLLWTFSGLVMTWIPIERVRGEHLRTEVPAVPLAIQKYASPADILAGSRAETLVLTRLLDQPVYRLEKGGKPFALKDAETGAPVAIDAALASQIATARYAGVGKVETVSFTAPDAAPREFRREVPAFAVHFDDDDGTVFYVHGITGDIAAVRTDTWRFYDFFWGLHIMDWQERDDFNHPLIIGAALLGTVAIGCGIALLVMRLRFRRQKRGARRPAEA